MPCMKEKFCVCVASAIIERDMNGRKQILIQTRRKPEYDPKYTGSIKTVSGRGEGDWVG